MRSRKKIAEKFQDWVCEVIEEIRKRGRYDLEEQMKIKELEYQQRLESTQRELQLLQDKTYEEIEKTGHIYVIKTDALGAYKVGKTRDSVLKRVKGLQTANRQDIEIILDFRTSNPDLLERVVHYVLDRYRCNSNREFFDCNVEYIQTVVEVAGKVIDTLKSSYQNIGKHNLLSKLKAEGLDIGLERRLIQKEIEETTQEDTQTNDLEAWLEENIVYKQGSILRLTDVSVAYLGKRVGPRTLTKFRTHIERLIKKKFRDVDYKFMHTTYNGINFKGWMNFKLRC